jgi:hypothetical protein
MVLAEHGSGGGLPLLPWVEPVWEAALSAAGGGTF